MSLTRNQYYHTFYTVDSSYPTRLTQTVYDNSGTLVQTVDISFGTTNAIDVLNLLDANSNQPYTLGLVDTSNTAVCSDLAYFNIYNKALSTTQKSKLIPYINKTYKEPRTNATTIYTVTVSGGVYNIGGVAQPTLTFTSGNLYVFDQSHISNAGNTLVLGTGVDTGIVGNNVVYNGTAGSINAYTLIDFSGANVAPLKLYYFSQTKTGMGQNPVVIFLSLKNDNTTNTGRSTSVIINGVPSPFITPPGTAFSTARANQFQIAIPANISDGYTFACYLFLTGNVTFFDIRDDTTDYSNSITGSYYFPTGTFTVSVNGNPSNVNLSGNSWSHLSITYTKSGYLTAYVNGQKTNTLSNTTQNRTFTNIYFFKSFSNTSLAYSYSGSSIYNFIYYDKILTDSEITTLYNRGGTA